MTYEALLGENECTSWSSWKHTAEMDFKVSFSGVEKECSIQSACRQASSMC